MSTDSAKETSKARIIRDLTRSRGISNR